MHEAPDYAVIRRHSAAGGQEAGMLRRSEARAAPWRPTDRVFLRADDDGFALISRRAQRIYTGSGRDPLVRSIPFGRPPRCGEVTGTALHKSTMILSCEKSSYPDANGETIFSLMILDRASGAALTPFLPLEQPAVILGTDGETVVLLQTRTRQLVKVDPPQE